MYANHKPGLTTAYKKILAHNERQIDSKCYRKLPKERPHFNISQIVFTSRPPINFSGQIWNIRFSLLTNVVNNNFVDYGRFFAVFFVPFFSDFWPLFIFCRFFLVAVFFFLSSEFLPFFFVALFLLGRCLSFFLYYVFLM